MKHIEYWILGLGFVGFQFDRRGFRFGRWLFCICFAGLLISIPYKFAGLPVGNLRLFHSIFPIDSGLFRIIWITVTAILTGILLKQTKLKTGRNDNLQNLFNNPVLEKSMLKLLGNADRKCGLTLLGMADPGAGMFLRRKENPVYINPCQRERHVQIVGPTRSGKSQVLLSIAWQDMKAGMPCFFMEAKGDISDFNQFLKLTEKCGRLNCVRYFNPADSRSMSLNPILPIAGQDPIALANQISRAIGREPGGEGDAEYFKSVDYARIQSLSEIFMSIYESRGLSFTLRDVFYYFEYDKCREKAFSMCSDKHSVDLAKRSFAGKSDTSALSAKLRPWVTGRLGNILNSYAPEIVLEKVFEESLLMYAAIPIGHLQVLANPLGRMIIAALLSIASQRQIRTVKPPPASVILDEFPEFATPAFAVFVATVGSARFWTIFSHQDLGQLRKVQGMDVEAFISTLFANSSGCKVCFHTPHPEDAELFARMIGTSQVHKITEVIEEGIWGGDMCTGRKSRREIEEFKIHPNILKSLPPGCAVAIPHNQAESIISTPKIYKLTADMQTPEITKPAVKQRAGLDLRSAAMNSGSKKG